ncbi:hypothetical protein WMF20_39985 [Sorangium sp. So ce834]|uniref:hypothetical protein n=1 Tax=Sorangium sp. So ce834 TaxID=3133321 RepID=UPI003F5DB1B3
MMKMFRGFGAFAVAGMALVAGLGGCTAQAGDDEDVFGSISLPLAAEAPSGAQYRLRNATFEIRSGYYYYYEDENVGVGVVTSGGGASYPGNLVLTVNSEDEDPDASSILVDLEQGSYNVTLLPGWTFEKVQGGTVTPVEATLLSSQTVYTYVSPHSTTWAQYQFGIGDRALWLNGKLNINIDVYEDPSEYYYGQGGAGGAGGFETSTVGVGGSWPGTGGAGGFETSTVGVGGSWPGTGGAGGYAGAGGGSP